MADPHDFPSFGGTLPVILAFDRRRVESQPYRGQGVAALKFKRVIMNIFVFLHGSTLFLCEYDCVSTGNVEHMVFSVTQSGVGKFNY